MMPGLQLHDSAPENLKNSRTGGASRHIPSRYLMGHSSGALLKVVLRKFSIVITPKPD